jgi:hypothetical protein
MTDAAEALPPADGTPRSSTDGGAAGAPARRKSRMSAAAHTVLAKARRRRGAADALFSRMPRAGVRGHAPVPALSSAARMRTLHSPVQAC